MQRAIVCGASRIAAPLRGVHDVNLGPSEWAGDPRGVDCVDVRCRVSARESQMLAAKGRVPLDGDDWQCRF